MGIDEWQYAENLCGCQRRGDEPHEVFNTDSQRSAGLMSVRHWIVFSAWSYFFTKR
jgi:hypothetical protein